MIELHGRWYDGRSSRAHAARLSIYPDGEVHLILAGETRAYPFTELAVSSRVGDAARLVTFPDGGQLETHDHEALDAALTRFGAQRATRWLHALESHWRAVAVSAVLVVAAVAGGVVFGIPALARVAAFTLPAETNAAIGRGALDLLDRGPFEPSALDAATRARLESLFANVVPEEEDFLFDLRLRRGGRLGANAFALPSGTIVLTDELVELARDDAELTAVLAHEVGHVVHRHALRQVIQSSAVALLVILVTGDLSSTSSLVAAVPTLLVETRFSRRFEREADGYALAHLRREGIDPGRFAALLRRIQERTGEAPLAGFLSTHPPYAERIHRFEDAAGSATPAEDAPERG